MTASAIETAIKARLATLALPKAWPNQDYDPTASGKLPYIACDLVKADTTDATLDGVQPVSTGRLIATVVVARGTSTATANGHADTIAALFPMGQSITAGTQTITITQPPHIREGAADGAYWRVPISIPYTAI